MYRAPSELTKYVVCDASGGHVSKIDGTAIFCVDLYGNTNR